MIGNKNPTTTYSTLSRRYNKAAVALLLHLFPLDMGDVVATTTLLAPVPSFEPSTTTTTTTSLLTMSSSDADSDALKSIAEALGYLIGAASVLLYTPIAVRIWRTKSADGLTVSTWWLKLISYTCTNVYNIKNGFPLTSFSETIVLTVEVILVLGLVSYYQKRMDSTTFAIGFVYLAFTSWTLLSPFNTLPYGPPDEWIRLAQILATILNTSALLPQIQQNYENKSSGGYSPITTTLASVGCTLRIFTTLELTGGDTLILLNYGVALALNMTVLLQVLYFGTQTEGKSVMSLFLADIQSSSSTSSLLNDDRKKKIP